MPNKGESKTLQLTPIKLDGPRTFGDNGKAWNVIVSESIPDAFEVYNAEGMEAIAKVLGQTVEFTVEFSNQFQGQDKWKVIKAPGWERGAGGGRSGRQYDPRPNLAIGALNAAVAVSGLNTETEAVTRIADSFFEWLMAAAKVSPASSEPIPSPNGQPESEGTVRMISPDEIDRILEYGTRLGLADIEIKKMLRPQMVPSEWWWGGLTAEQGQKAISYLEQKLNEARAEEAKQGALG